MRGSEAVDAGETVGSPSRERWRQAAETLDRWMRARDYAGHDPYDILASPLIRRLTLGHRLLAIAWTQLGRRSPVQLRPLLGVPRARNAKGIGLVLAAQVRLWRATGADRHRDQARALADWLAANTATGWPGAGWGYPFPWANRDFAAAAGTPSSVVTSFIGHALLDAWEAFGWNDARDLALRAGTFLREALNRLPGPDDTFCFSYTPLDRRAVHNASLLAASLLARLGRLSDDADLLADANAAARFSVRAQRPDGSWAYGLGARNAWVDSFHSGYVLLALREIGAAAGGTEFEDAIARGLAYWHRAFLIGPAVAYHAGRPFPVDVHAVAHAILVLLAFRDRLAGASETAARLGDWCLEEMRDPAGFFYYRLQAGGRKNRLPYMRWIQAWMLLALAELAVNELAEPPGEGGDMDRRDRTS